jgi:hypothetical protein
MEGLNGHFCHGFYPQVRPKSLFYQQYDHSVVLASGLAGLLSRAVEL